MRIDAEFEHNHNKNIHFLFYRDGVTYWRCRTHNLSTHLACEQIELNHNRYFDLLRAYREESVLREIVDED